MAESNVRRPCTKCKTAGGIAICDGCGGSFCSNHFIEHREELALEMDNIGQNCDLFRRDLSGDVNEHRLIARINSWEKESIEKIQKAAAIARADLQKIMDNIKNDLETSSLIMFTEIKTSRDSKDYTEKDFQRWNEKLEELRRAFETPLNVNLENDCVDDTSIALIKISDQKQSASILSSTINENHFVPNEKSNLVFNDEKFDVKTDAILSENNLRALCVPKYSSRGVMVYGFNTYLCGTHDISLRIEKKGISRLFFGIYSGTKKRIDSISGYDNSVYGWWDIDSSVMNGIKQESTSEHIISTGDKIVLTLDCNRQQIQLYHVGQNRSVQLAVDVTKCPYPWKLIIKLTSNGDCVRVL